MSRPPLVVRPIYHAHPTNDSMFDFCPSISVEKVDKVIHKLENRRSYLAKAPHQRRSKKQVLSDTIMKLCPATWLAPVILKAHAQYEYREARQQAENLHFQYEERRKSGMLMSTNSVVALETVLAPVDQSPLSGGEAEDPWKLPSCCRSP